MATSKRPMPLMVRAKETTPPSVTTGGRLISELSPLPVIEDGLMFVLMRPNDGMAYKGTFLQLKNAVLSKEYAIMQAVDGDTSSPLMQQTTTSSFADLLTWNTDGLSSDLTSSDSSTGVITVGKDGIYEVDVSISFSGSLSKTYVFEIFKHVPTASPVNVSTGFRLDRKLGTSGDVGSASLSGLISLNASEGVSLHVKSTDGGTALLVHQSQMKVSQI